jgi:uncharacterized protein YdaU (DUF1376 family)
MNRPWMPLYVADYLADTAHLNAAQSGAYLHLIMHYWQKGCLPADDESLMRIARMTAVEWKKNKGTLRTFFQDGWKHKRIDDELAHALEVSSKRRTSAMQRHSKPSANGHAIAEHLDTHARATPQPQSPSEAKASAPANLEKQLFDRGKSILGKNAGGLIANLIKAKGSIALARAALETAAAKASPREYVGACIRGENQDAEVRGDAW